MNNTNSYSQRLNELGQVSLYPPMVEDLGLKEGDLVIFFRNAAGRWEVCSGEEIATLMKLVTQAELAKIEADRKAWRDDE